MSIFSNISNEKLLSTGITITRSNRTESVDSLAHPLHFLDHPKDQRKMYDLLTASYNHERSIRSSRKDSIILESLRTSPGFPEPIKNPFNKNKPVYTSVGLTLFVVSHYIAFDEEIRTLFLNTVGDGALMPSIIKETTFRTRSSMCGRYYLKPKLNFSRIDEFLDRHSFFKNTLLDPYYLRTREGMSNFFLLTARLDPRQFGENYYTTVESKVLRAVSLVSGEQTTFNSLHTFNENDIHFCRLLNHNSYTKSSPPETHVLDATLTQVQLVRNGTSLSLEDSDQLEVNFTADTNFAVYITERGLGVLPNSSGIEEPKVQQLPVETTLPETVFKQRKQIRNKTKRNNFSLESKVNRLEASVSKLQNETLTKLDKVLNFFNSMNSNKQSLINC